MILKSLVIHKTVVRLRQDFATKFRRMLLSVSTDISIVHWGKINKIKNKKTQNFVVKLFSFVSSRVTTIRTKKRLILGLRGNFHISVLFVSISVLRN